MKNFLRKANSLLVALFAKWRMMCVRIKFRACGVNIKIGQQVSIGRMVRVQATDGGEIVIGDGVAIQDFCLLCVRNGCLEIGDNTFVGVGSQLVAIESIKIGSDCLISAYCIVRDANHGMERGVAMSRQAHNSAPIIIGDDVWLGAHVVVTAGSTIGTGAVVGANAVVTGDLSDFSVSVGVPARTIKFR